MKRKKSLSMQLKLILTGMAMSVTTVFAQAPAVNQKSDLPGIIVNPDFYLVAGILIILLVATLALAKITVSLSKVVSQAKKKSTVIIFLLMSSVSAHAQSAELPKANPTPLPEILYNPNFYLLTVLFIIMIAAIFVLYKVNMVLIQSLNPKTDDVIKASIPGVIVEKEPTFMRKVYLGLVDSVPVAQEKDILLDHDYDGIKELDNNLPPWWKYGFYVTIIFGFFYLLNYHFFAFGKLQTAEYQEELVIAEQQKMERMKASADNVNEENVTVLTDADLISKGRETYQKLCAACHLANGGGQVGPNLTDEFWIHGGGIKDLFKVVTYGVQNKGMISWKSQLSPKQIQQVTSYILTLKGTNPVGGKEPQGDKWVEAGSPVDSTSNASAITDSTQVALLDSLKR